MFLTVSVLFFTRFAGLAAGSVALGLSLAGLAAMIGAVPVRAAGRQPRKRSSDLQIAATAASNLLPLYTANPADFQGTEGLVEIVSVKARPNNL